MIVVCATFDVQNQPQSFSRSVEERSVFHLDLRENLIPAVESRFHTYAENTTEEGLEASREHRAFGGFSLGQSRLGTSDPIWDQTDSQIQEMLQRERFTPENLHYAIIEGGRHDIDACERYLYHGLRDFFG